MDSVHWHVRLGRMRRQFLMMSLGVMPRAAFQLLPKTSREFGPPRRFSTWPKYRRQHPEVKWLPVFPATPCSYPAPQGRGDLGQRLWKDGWPELGVAILPNGRALNGEGLPIGERDTLLVDIATGLERPEYSSYLSRRCQMDTARSGRALNLGTVFGSDNYCHFVLEALPRLELFWRAGFTFDDVDWILVPSFPGSAREPFLRALGLPSEKIVYLQNDVQFQFRELVQPTFPGRECYSAPWVAEFYRERLLKPQGIIQERKLRLYVARSFRGLTNDAELWAELQARGFIRLEPATWEENVRTFASADLIVGPHGAGLSNVIFAPPGGQLIEILPGDRAFPFFYSAASSAGLSYRGVLTSPLAPVGREYRRLPSDKPYAVNVAEVIAAVDTFLPAKGG